MGKKRARRQQALAFHGNPSKDPSRIVATSPLDGRPHVAARPVVLWIFGLVLLTLGVFLQIGQHDFVSYDDKLYVTENRRVQEGLTWDGVRWALTTMHSANWHPVTWLSHMLDCTMSGMNPRGHHLTSLGFHLMNVLLLFGWLSWTTGRVGLSGWVAALFAIHPMRVESVAWVAERKDVLSTCWWLVTMWAYVWWVRRRGWWRYAVIMASMGIGLMAKPMLVSLPLILLLIDVWPLQRSEKLVSRCVEKLPLALLACASSVITLIAQRAGGAMTSVEQLSVGVRLANAAVSYVAYIGKLLWPTHLSVFYPHHASMLSPVAVCGAVIALAVITWGVLRATRLPALRVGWGWYMASLLPVIGIVQVGAQAMADRYTYVPHIGLGIMAAWGAAALAGDRHERRMAVAAVGAVAVVLWGVVARTQVSVWENSRTLFEHALSVTTGNHVAHHNLGSVLAEEGQFAQAVQHYRQALPLNPRNAQLHSDLGAALGRLGEDEAAVEHLTEALRLRPDFGEAHSNLGVLLARRGRLPEAIESLRKAVSLTPESTEAQANLGAALASQGLLDEAVVHLQEAVRLRPEFAAARANLERALAQRDGRR